MKYLLLICSEQPPYPPLEIEEDLPSQESEDDNDDIETWFAEIDKRGSRLIGSQVSLPSSAATARSSSATARTPRPRSGWPAST